MSMFLDAFFLHILETFSHYPPPPQPPPGMKSEVRGHFSSWGGGVGDGYVFGCILFHFFEHFSFTSLPPPG